MPCKITKSTKGILLCFHLHPLPQLFCHLRSNIDPCVSEIILDASKELVLGKFFVQKPSLRPSFPCITSLVLNFSGSSRWPVANVNKKTCCTRLAIWMKPTNEGWIHLKCFLWQFTRGVPWWTKMDILLVQKCQFSITLVTPHNT